MTTTPAPARADLATLYERHHIALVRLAVNLVDDVESAEDVVQDVFAALARQEPPVDALRYLRTAVVNRSRSILRRRRTARAFGRRPTVLTDAEPADARVLRDENTRTMLAAIDGLPRRQREAVVLRYYEDLPVAEIAAVLGIRAGAVSTSLHRALSASPNESEEPMSTELETRIRAALRDRADTIVDAPDELVVRRAPRRFVAPTAVAASIALVATLAIVLASLGGTSRSPAGGADLRQLVGTGLTLRSVQHLDAAAVAIPDRIAPDIAFGRDGRFDAYDGVNSLSGRYRIAGDALVVGPAGSTYAVYRGKDPARLAAMNGVDAIAGLTGGAAHVMATLRAGALTLSAGGYTLVFGDKTPLATSSAPQPSSTSVVGLHALVGTAWTMRSVRHGKDAPIAIAASRNRAVTFGRDGNYELDDGTSTSRGPYSIGPGTVRLGLNSAVGGSAGGNNPVEAMVMAATSALVNSRGLVQATLHGESLTLSAGGYTIGFDAEPA